MIEKRDDQSSGAARGTTLDLPPPPGSDWEAGKEGHGDVQTGPPLMGSESEERFRSRWMTIQAAFVDEPSRAVRQADGLVAEVMKQIAEVFAQERSRLEEQWARQEEVSTEELRVALQRYRSFFDRLLGVWASPIPHKAVDR